MPFRSFTARLIRSVFLSDQTRHLEFEMQGVPRFDFVAGQWLSFQHRHSDGQEITRAYSIASPPAEGNGFALCLNRVANGFMSNFLCELREGEELSCQGPFGDFILRPPVRDMVFIATGTGIAPFRSMLHWLFGEESRHQGQQFWLVFGSRSETDIYYHQEFLGLAAGHAGFSAIRVAVHLDTDADEAAVAELHRRVAATSPVGQTLSNAIPVEINPA